MRKDEKYDQLESCVEQVKSGEDLENVLKMYPGHEKNLRQPLEAAQAVRWLAADTQVPNEALERGRDKFLQNVEIKRRAAAQRRYRPAFRSSPSRHASGQSPLTGLRLAMTVLLFIVVLLIGAGTSFTASAGALPGEPLYPIKIAQEDIRMWLTRDLNRKIELEKSFDQERLEEVRILVDRSRLQETVNPVNLRLSGALVISDSGEWMVDNVKVLLTPDTQLIGQVEPGYFVEVEGQLLPEGVISASRIRLRQLRLEGMLDQDVSGLWTVGNVPFLLSSRILLSAELKQGIPVTVILVQNADGSFEARSVQIHSEDENDQSSESEQEISPSNENNKPLDQEEDEDLDTNSQDGETEDSGENKDESSLDTSEPDEEKDRDDDNKKDDDAKKGDNVDSGSEDSGD
jgi:hypothetical protein